MAESIFEPAGEGRYVATEAALSPWSSLTLHGGPPAMLLAREIEGVGAEQPMTVVRLTVELMRPIGRVPLAVSSRISRPGRKAQLVEASLWHGEQELARATALRLRTAGLDVPTRREAPPHELPEPSDEWFAGWTGGPAYHSAGVEGRAPKSRDRSRGPGWAWFRLRLPLVPGEEPTPLVRVCAAADFPNGISYVVDPRRTSFVNPDLTVHLQRPPAGEWVLVDAQTRLEPTGVGLAEAVLYDRDGRIGSCVQSLLLEPRSP